MLAESLLTSLAAQVARQPPDASRLHAGEPLATTLQRLLSGLVVIGLEVAAVAAICGGLYVAIRMLLSRAAALRGGSLAEWSAAATGKARTIFVATSLLLTAGLLAFNVWLMARGLDARVHTTALIASIDARTWGAIGIALLKLAAATAGLIVAAHLLRRLLGVAERTINRWDGLQGNNESLSALFVGLDRVIVNTAWMVLAVIACGWFAVPSSVTAAVMVVIRVYLVIAIGVVVVRCATTIVDTIDGLSQRSAERRGWVSYYNHLRPLLPTFRTCLDYALWIAVGSMVLLQVGQVSGLAAWGPRLIQGIGIFFLGRVIIELGTLELGHRLLPPEGLEEADRRRRATMLPLVRSGFTYAVYFGTAVLILSSLGFNPMPFLAGAGILGLVVGFGAQSLINDVVSGFFILFENIYLVGDMVEVAGAKGVVEAIEFRTTKIRDEDGRLHVIRNGDTKPLINYSRDYSKAVVAVEMTYDADLLAVFNALREAGARLRATNADVLADTDVLGVTAFGPSTMTVVTATRVKPGRHDAVAADLRFLIKETFDRRAIALPRKAPAPPAVEERAPRSKAAGQGP